MAVPDNDELFYDALGLLRNLISVPSLSRDESAAAEIRKNVVLILTDLGITYGLSRLALTKQSQLCC